MTTKIDTESMMRIESYFANCKLNLQIGNIDKALSFLDAAKGEIIYEKQQEKIPPRPPASLVETPPGHPGL